jgi:chromosome segregation and condensation protein ScpB
VRGVSCSGGRSARRRSERVCRPRRCARSNTAAAPHRWAPTRSSATRRLEGDHLAALAACLVVQRGGLLADFAAALEISMAAVREGVLGVADRLAAIGLEAVVDDVEVRLAPLPAAAAAVGRLTDLSKIPQVTEEQLEIICLVAHLGVATRAQLETQLGHDCEPIIRRLLGRGLVEKVDTRKGAIKGYRVTAKAIAATGHDNLASLQGFLAASVVG